MITVKEVDKTYCDIMELSFNYILFDYWLRKRNLIDYYEEEKR